MRTASGSESGRLACVVASGGLTDSRVLPGEKSRVGTSCSLLWFAVTRNPTAEWLARQITEAFPWDSAPKYLIRDNARVFGAVFKARVRAMGIRDRPTSFRSPWQNGYVERLIGSIRRECTDHCWCSTPSTFGESSRNTRPITMRFGPTFRSGKMRPADGPSNGSATLSCIRFLADYTIAMLESSFRK